MSKLKRFLVIIASFTCLAACLGDFLVTINLGKRYPGFSQVSDVMSLLGSSGSPVSNSMSSWWVILGIFFIIFATGFRIAYSGSGKFIKIAFWMIVIYAVGEDMGSGLFKADTIEGSMTTSYIIHNIFGGAGICAILFLPLAVERIYPFSESPGFRIFSRSVLVAGLILLFLFSFRLISIGNNFVERSAGLWQRLFALDYYLYLLLIAFFMFKRSAIADHRPEFTG
jgi:hypothetical protein